VRWSGKAPEQGGTQYLAGRDRRGPAFLGRLTVDDYVLVKVRRLRWLEDAILGLWGRHFLEFGLREIHLGVRSFPELVLEVINLCRHCALDYVAL
jgi:hypothetical protein